MKQTKIILILLLFAAGLSAQDNKDTTDRRFHDDLLDHLVGNWHDTAVAHGSTFKSEVDVRWVLNHQYLLIHLKSNEVIPWWGVPMEFYEYIGYNHYKKRYTVHGMSIEGDEDLSEGFGYGYRSGNVFKTESKFSNDTIIIQRFTWNPETKIWRIQSTTGINGKESEVFLDMKLTKIG